LRRETNRFQKYFYITSESRICESLAKKAGR
jgi:hypothetical protein